MATSLDAFKGYVTHMPGPRPKVKAKYTENGIPVKVCESHIELRVRRERLRRPGDMRSPERLL